MKSDSITERINTVKLISTTKYNLDAFKKFHRFNMFKGNRIVCTLCIALIAAGLGFSIYMLALSGDSAYIFALVMLGLLSLYLVFGCFIMPIMSNKSSSVSSGSNRFTFDEEGIRLGEEDSQQFKRLLRYKSLYRAYETDDWFYIYMFKQSALMVDKSGFSEGNPDDLRELLNSQMNSKVVDRRRNR